jgi:hypothetical protein
LPDFGKLFKALFFLPGFVLEIKSINCTKDCSQTPFVVKVGGILKNGFSFLQWHPRNFHFSGGIQAPGFFTGGLLSGKRQPFCNRLSGKGFKPFRRNKEDKPGCTGAFLWALAMFSDLCPPAGWAFHWGWILLLPRSAPATAFIVNAAPQPKKLPSGAFMQTRQR